MANTPNKKTPPSKATETITPSVTEEVKTKAETPVQNGENEALKQKLADMETKMAMMMQMMGNNLNASQSASNSDRDIEVVSLVTGTLLLTTTGLDSGQKYEFKNQFDTILIPESDLRAIVRSMPETARGGYFYVADTKFVEDVKLAGSYRNMMNKNELVDIFNKPHTEFIATYNHCTQGQKIVIVEMAVSKKMNGEFVDANILMELGKACNRDLMSIEPLENLVP